MNHQYPTKILKIRQIFIYVFSLGCVCIHMHRKLTKPYIMNEYFQKRNFWKNIWKNLVEILLKIPIFSFYNTNILQIRISGNLINKINLKQIFHCCKCICVLGSDPHLDNRVHPMHAPYATKHERLAAECSRPEAQTDCLPGQKWRCERDGHRWRRHKCRYAAPPPPQKVSKKCACFTPNGVIYTRLESNDYDGQRYGFTKDRRPVDPYDDTAGFFTKRGDLNVIIVLHFHIYQRKK